MTQTKLYHVRGVNHNMVITEELDIVIQDSDHNASIKNIVCNEIVMASFSSDKDAIMIADSIWTAIKRGKLFIDIMEMVYGES